MRYLFNEKGYALLMVLMLILLFTVLGMGLFAMNMNASKQFNMKEEQVQARHQAEMGVLHYQKELEQYIKTNKPTAITNAALFCSNISPLTVSSALSDKKYTTTLKKTDCSIANGVVIIPLKSIGIAGQKGTEIVEAKLYLTNPVSMPQKPSPPTSGNVTSTEPPCLNDNNVKSSNQDCNKIYDKFTEIDMITLKKGNILFKDHLVVGNITVEGGKEASITVEKDLYIENNFYVQNHACIAVQGDFTILGDDPEKQSNSKKNDKTNNDYFGNKTYLYIYGNVNLPEEPTFQNGNSGIYINGDVYIKGLKITPKPSWAKTFNTASGHKDNSSSCTLPGENPANIKWSLDDKIDAEYK